MGTIVGEKHTNFCGLVKFFTGTHELGLQPRAVNATGAPPHETNEGRTGGRKQGNMR